MFSDASEAQLDRLHAVAVPAGQHVQRTGVAEVNRDSAGAIISRLPLVLAVIAAITFVLLFLLTGLLSLLGWEGGVVAYFIIAALFLVYEPFSKIRHYIYYPFARYFYGASFGRRGVIGRE